MPGRSKRTKRSSSRLTRLKRRVRDVDEVADAIAKGEPPRGDPEDLPGAGEWRCAQCDRYFISENAQVMHLRSKVHKKRLKQLAELETARSLPPELAIDHGKPLLRETRRWISDEQLKLGLDTSSNPLNALALAAINDIKEEDEDEDV